MVESWDLSWQPYCEHSIVQSNPHFNPKQCTRRKTGKTNKSKPPERKKYISKIMSSYRRSNRGMTKKGPTHMHRGDNFQKMETKLLNVVVLKNVF